jgi:hypothetical protein
MADALYLSLWYPNLRLEALPDKLIAVLGAFAAHGGETGVYSATVWPVDWSEAPVFQRIYGRAGQGAEPRAAVQEALDLLHEDYAYEFQIGWDLWELEAANAGPRSTPVIDMTSAQGRLSASRAAPGAPHSAQEDISDLSAQNDRPNLSDQDDSILGRWVRGPRLVRVTGFGPLFDEGTYEQDGHIRIDFGSDTPFLQEDADLDKVGAKHIEENVRQLVELTAAVEKVSGATARLLWSELGESLAQRLADRLGMRN